MLDRVFDAPFPEHACHPSLLSTLIRRARELKISMIIVCMQQVGRSQDTGTLSSQEDAPADIDERTPKRPQSAGMSVNVRFS